MTNQKLIYGASSSYNFGRWTHGVFVFCSLEAANNWLNTQQNDFKTREILKNKTAAVKLTNATTVKKAEEHAAENEYIYTHVNECIHGI